MTTLTPALRPLPDVADRPDPRVVAAADPSASHLQARRWLGLAWVLCLAVQIWLISAGTMSAWPEYTTRYNLLARAFCLGQTNLPIPTNVRHLELADPYDPVANLPFRQKPGVPDSCLYAGRFYLYWGPVPALLLVPIKLIAGPGWVIGDQYLCFAFTQGLMLASAAILLRVRQRFFPQSPSWIPAAGQCVMALSTPMTCALTRSAVYEAAIIGGQCFLLAGIYLAWSGLTDDSDLSNRPARRLSRFACAGASLALAVGCRVSLAISVVAVAGFVVGRLAWAGWGRPSASKSNRVRLASVAPSLAAFTLPLMAGAFAIGWYNHIRFDSWSEFGQKYQLAGANLHSYGGLFGIANLWPGLWSYALRPAAIVGHFPWLIPVSGDDLFPSWIPIPPHYEHFEPITGVLWAMPFLWLGLAAWSGRDRRDDTRADQATLDSSKASESPNWLSAVLAVSAIAAFAPVLLMIGSSQRYLLDLSPPLVVLSTIGLQKLANRPSRRAARRGLTVGITLAAASVLLGLLLSIEGYSGHFRFFNPQLFSRLAGGVVVDPHIRTGQGIIDANR